MDLKEAFYKQKEEFQATNATIRRLEKELIKNKLHKRKELISNAVTSFTLAEVNDFFHKVDSLLEKAYREWFSVQSKYYSNEEKALLGNEDLQHSS